MRSGRGAPRGSSVGLVEGLHFGAVGPVCKAHLRTPRRSPSPTLPTSLGVTVVVSVLVAAAGVGPSPTSGAPLGLLGLDLLDFLPQTLFLHHFF